MEAAIAALFIDQGITVCQQWVNSLFADKLANLSLDSWEKDPKTQLQELMQSKKLSLPEYSLLTKMGPSHEQTFKVKCSVPLIEETSVGTGISRKRAEQDAAEQMLFLLKKEIE
jgi:ribonuclease-3